MHHLVHHHQETHYSHIFLDLCRHHHQTSHNRCAAQPPLAAALMEYDLTSERSAIHRCSHRLSDHHQSETLAVDMLAVTTMTIEPPLQ
ncbi:hypothetical protein L2E82_18324 [Cichorium intybus]|uniref:Uncharacterized protein n=1 Tax=Cichorium intybus TaxID=13427 RepID=A0ACB9F9S3_CICIN|nr:hypothetical protein L2E82_18324 [Cichorium intybus]